MARVVTRMTRSTTVKSGGGNSFSENLNYRHFMNTTRIVRTIPPREPTVDDIFGSYRKKHGI